MTKVNSFRWWSQLGFSAEYPSLEKALEYFGEPDIAAALFEGDMASQEAD